MRRSELEHAELQLEQQREELREVLAACSEYRLLSTLPFTKNASWNEHVDTVPQKRNILSRFTERAGIPDISVLFKLLARVHRYDLVLLTGGERVDLVYLALAALLPWVRTPHVVVDAHWQRADGPALLLQKMILRMGRRLTAQVQPHSTEEIILYHEIFGLPLEILRAVPWSTTLFGHDVSPAREDEQGDFVLTGGLSFRDYDTLLAAVRELDLRVEIGLPSNAPVDQVVALARTCPNVTVYTDWSNERFVRKIAGCRVFALPIEPGLTRSTADQTILNAMYFGKIVVATDSIGSRIYIEDRVNGFLVPERSIAGWAQTLKKVYSMSDEEYAAIGERAAHDARVRFNESIHLVRILKAALEARASFRAGPGRWRLPWRPSGRAAAASIPPGIHTSDLSPDDHAA
jgi:glycosyltransferase involved in cell wall biosynthesis